MPRGDKDAYTDKQKRKAEHIEDSYRERGLSEARAEEIAWATVNKEDGGGRKSGSGRKPAGSGGAKAGGTETGGAGGGSAADRSAAAKKGWETRRRNGTA